MSNLPQKVVTGHKAVVSGIPFKVSMQPCPVLEWELKTDTSMNGSL